MRKLAIVAVVGLAAALTSSNAQAHWQKTPWKINRLGTVNAKLEAYETNIQHSRNALRFAKNYKVRFTYKQWVTYLKAHKYVIRFSSWKIGQLRWQALPPHYSAWKCIHRYEGSWTDSGDPFWGGLQMDRSFMRSYAPSWLLRRGFANTWTPLEQMWVAERAYSSGRGFYPWPNTARYCNLI